MKLLSTIHLVGVLCNIQAVASERGRTVSQEPAESRALNDKWPPKNLDIPGNRRYHSWHWSGAATESQYRNTNRKGNRHPKSGGLEEHYDDDEEEEYHYGPSHSKNNKRPSETEFHHMVKMPKHSKNAKGKGGGGKGGKNAKGKGKDGGSSDDDCLSYYYVYEDDYVHRREKKTYYESEEEYDDEAEHYSEEYKLEENQPEEHYNQEYDDHYEYEIEHEPGKGSKGGKSRGKSPKSHKGSKSGKKTKICTEPPVESPPTVSPAPTGSNDMPSERPPIEPPAANPFTPSPTNEDSIAVELPAFALAYDVPDLQQPSRRDLDALGAATSLYLENFFFDEFDGNTFTIVDDFITELLESNFAQGMPIEVDYLSTSRFNPFSTIIPTEAQLNAALIDAFSGLNMLDYEVFLNDELPEGNIFIGSTVIFLQDEGGGQDPDTRSGVAATGIAAAAVAFTLLVAGIVIYKRRQDRKDPETDKLNKPSGDATIAGETFTGETYDGTVSISAASMEFIRRYRDEDETSKTVSNLGTIHESEDGDQMQQSWGVSGQSGTELEDEEAKINPSAQDVAQQPSEAFRDGGRMSSFEEVALQSFPNNIMQSSFSSSSDDSQSRGSSFEHSLGKLHTTGFLSTLSYDSMDGKTPSIASALSVRDNSTRRPRTVSEIEALLSADVGKGDDDTVASDASGADPSRRSSRPRTVEEIENLLHADLADDSTLELPFSDEDDTIGDA